MTTEQQTGRAVSLAEFRAMAGRQLGRSGWLTIDQTLVDRFARVTGDHQFIHVDPVRAGETPFGGTIAHGFLILSLLASLGTEAMPSISGAELGINAGFNRVRFLTPVPTGSRIRATFALAECVEQKPGSWRTVLDCRVEVDGEDKPALVAEWLNIWVVGAEP